MKKVFTQMSFFISILVIVSLACSFQLGGSEPAATTAPAATEAPTSAALPTEKPTDVPQPTAVPPTVGPEEFFTEEFDDSADMENWVAFSFGPGADDNANLRIEQEGEGVTFDLGALDLYEYYMYTPFT